MNAHPSLLRSRVSKELNTAKRESRIRMRDIAIGRTSRRDGQLLVRYQIGQGDRQTEKDRECLLLVHSHASCQLVSFHGRFIKVELQKARFGEEGRAGKRDERGEWSQTCQHKHGDLASLRSVLRQRGHGSQRAVC